ncbi:hypothetical protein TC41_2230 [Alicyclobacillus acidocaldarius subsp. acidocaldarius Tc-4-1]|uniref:Uncharacterized protein n=1 Tax=Alicyclobacillus acidocaldarius (strain Tc-4-1) TaxID=1048834 RepID=F8IFQ3_ALIAT|nr:hypothetical protein TC41_2230 [Alicyclobacillus acidocaldarius subsp. acidocaldarius Tc-4-1]
MWIDISLGRLRRDSQDKGYVQGNELIARVRISGFRTLEQAGQLVSFV